MAFRMSEQARTIKIYNLLAGTNEFIGEGDAYIPPHTGLPANSTDIAPPDIPAGFVAVFNSDEASWHLVEDHRGKTVYDVASGDALFISELGLLPENVTWLSPEGEFQKWNGTAWVKDTEAEKLFRIREAEETKNNLMQVASEHIAPLQDAVDLEIATEEETSLLEAWKKYRVLLNRVDTSTAQDIEWPANPVRSNHWDMPQHVVMQERAAVGCYFFLKRKTLLHSTLNLGFNILENALRVYVKPLRNLFVFEKMPF